MFTLLRLKQLSILIFDIHFSVLVEKDRYLKITDFGTSRVIGSHSTVMTVIGSCAWMAPEMIRNERCNDKVDVWSYGILLWELLTQEVPYKVCSIMISSILYASL